MKMLNPNQQLMILNKNKGGKMINWRTTAAGVVGAIVMNIISYIQSGGVDMKVLVSSAVMAAIGYLAKDAGVSGIQK